VTQDFPDEGGAASSVDGDLSCLWTPEETGLPGRAAPGPDQTALDLRARHTPGSGGPGPVPEPCPHQGRGTSWVRAHL